MIINENRWHKVKKVWYNYYMLINYLKQNWWKYLIVFFVIFVDMLTKFLIVTPESLAGSTPIIKDIIEIAPTYNYGAGFSVLYGKTWLLIAISALFIVGIIVFHCFFNSKSVTYNISMALIFAGAVGNLIDRIIFGYVRDFIYFKIIDFPVFNVADIALTFGVIFMIIFILFLNKNDAEIKKKKVLAKKGNHKTDDNLQTNANMQINENIEAIKTENKAVEVNADGKPDENLETNGDMQTVENDRMLNIATANENDETINANNDTISTDIEIGGNKTNN